ncbi:MAG: hypothetical protein Q7U10_07015 [Thermodesulfovibrionia bacterium]|nr:hypothetical protein [Thermodesulfovibrionia bacterium]
MRWPTELITIISGLVVIITGVVAAWRFIVRWRRKHKTPITKNEVSLLADRFIDLFKAHGIERTQIPRFLGEPYNLTLSDVSTNTTLLTRLDENILSAVCELFGVQREWLDKGSVPMYTQLSFYKDMNRYVGFLSEITKKYDRVQGFAIKSPEDKLKKTGNRLPIALLFQVYIGILDDEPIYKYYLADDEWYWDYDRTRIQLKAMFFAAFQFQVFICGCELPKSEIKNLIAGRAFPGPLVNNLNCVRWHPDEYICTSEESPVAIDSKEALIAREYMANTGWLQKLENITGKKAVFSL